MPRQHPRHTHQDGGQRGSLVLGLALLTSTLLLGGILLLSSLHNSWTFRSAAERRADTLAAKSRQTQALNRIAANNALTIAILADALEGYAEATIAAVAYQGLIPFWKSNWMKRPLPEQEPVARYFNAASMNFARDWSRAFALTVDSASARKDLATENMGWHRGLATLSPQETLCLALRVLDSRARTTAMTVAQTTSLRKIDYVFAAKDDCSITISHSGRDKSVLPVKRLLESARIPEDMDVVITIMNPQAPLEQPVLPEWVTWAQSPLTLLRGTPHRLRLGVGRVKLIHPRLSPTQRDSTQVGARGFEALLEPHWVPVYVTDELGG